MTHLLPLAYGYLRADMLRDRDPDSGADRLRAAAESFGYALGTVFYEPAPQHGILPPAFVELVQECRRTEARAVLTLRGHLSGMTACRTILMGILGVRTDAAIRELEPNG
ncbi:hypothetical protein ABIA39_007696 [Nocardia sp. GAS34]|uniref:hypothetical protein n=1 Tax=unclassified Nocardia TaxID=2637762 RepID=UPI003D1D7DB2